MLKTMRTDYSNDSMNEFTRVPRMVYTRPRRRRGWRPVPTNEKVGLDQAVRFYFCLVLQLGFFFYLTITISLIINQRVECYTKLV